MPKENYTKEMTEELSAAYKAAGDDKARALVVESFAEKFGKTKPSIRQKLVREGIYIKKEYRTKSGDKPVTKEQLVLLLADRIGCLADQLQGAEKATKSALQTILDALPDKIES